MKWFICANLKSYRIMEKSKKRRVLVALDYNFTGQKVAEIGYALAKALNGEIVFLHVVTNAVYHMDATYSPEMRSSVHMATGRKQPNNNDTLKKAALGFLNKLKEQLGDQSIHTRIEEGESAETILKTAREMHADILIMGSHSNRKQERIPMGSVTERVMLHAKIPIIIVPTKDTNGMELSSGKQLEKSPDPLKEMFNEDYQ
jgi:nucleotide-binding universal stress UspA family protein